VRARGFFGGGGGFSGALIPATVEFAWMGALTASGVTVKARITAGTPTLIHALNASLLSPTAVSGTEGADDVWTFTLSGLDPDTEYHWSILGWSEQGRFRTLPTAGSQASFAVTAASCAGSPPGGANAEYQGPGDTSNTPAWARILDRLPLLHVNLGDWGYPDITSGIVGDYRQNYRDNAANARQAALWRGVPYVYTWSDHDYSDADSDGTYSGKAGAQQAFREYVPHYTLPEGSSGPIYHKFSIGRTEWFLLDTYSEATARGATDNSSKTMLGATQKQWLKDELLASTAKVLVISVNWPWNEPSGWGAYSTERAELADYFEDNGLTDKILLLQADWHFCAFDDGTNTHYASTGSAPGPPIFHFAPLDQNETSSSGTYSEGTEFDNQMYGLMEFTDAGATISVKGTAFSCPDISSEIEELSYTHVFDGT